MSAQNARADYIRPTRFRPLTWAPRFEKQTLKRHDVNVSIYQLNSLLHYVVREMPPICQCINQLVFPTTNFEK